MIAPERYRIIASACNIFICIIYLCIHFYTPPVHVRPCGCVLIWPIEAHGEDTHSEKRYSKKYVDLQLV